MRKNHFYLAAALTLCPASAMAQSQAAYKVIDDFTDGDLHQQMPAAFSTSYRAANSALGKVRQTTTTAADLQGLGTVSNLDIGAHHLIVSSGFYSSFGLYLGYGYAMNGTSGGMHEDFTGCDLLRIDFEASDAELGYAIQVLDGNGVTATLDGTTSTAARIQSFSAEFPIAAFDGFDSEGNARAVDWKNIEYVIVLFQSGSAIGANDFAVHSIGALGNAKCGSSAS